MPTRFTPEQLAASAAAGEPRTEESFGGDRDAWHAYQLEWFTTFTLGEVLPMVGDNNRAKRWKAARRQHGKIEAQREKEQNAQNDIAAGDAAAFKRLKVPDRWIVAHAPALKELNAHSPAVTPGGKHAKRLLCALIATPDGCEREFSEEVCYSLPPKEGEERWRAEQRDDRHRGREQLALERLQHAPERAIRAQQQATEAAAAAEAAKAAQEAEAEAREQRRAAVVRDGNTLYDAHTFKRIDPLTRSALDERLGLVFLPDGSSRVVPEPRRNGRFAAERVPCRAVEPWRGCGVAVPPLDDASLEELRRISTALLSRSSLVWSAAADTWREQHLFMEVCCDGDCVNRCDCVTFRPPGLPPSAAELSRIGLTSDVARAWEPFHVALGEEGCWTSWGRSGRQRAEDAVARAAFPEADVPPTRTYFTPIAASAGLPVSLQYIRVGDVVLYKGEPHFVANINGVGGGELLLRTPEQHGRGRGLANGELHNAAMQRVAKLLEPAREVDAVWARTVADAVKAGSGMEMLPPPPPPPPVWRSPSAHRREITDWTFEAKAIGLSCALQELQPADVVVWHAQPYFVVHFDGIISGSRGKQLNLLPPADFARRTLGERKGCRGPGWVELTLPLQERPLPTAEELLPEELQEVEERRRERDEWLAELRDHLAVADAATTEAARADADAAAAAYKPLPSAPVSTTQCGGRESCNEESDRSPSQRKGGRKRKSAQTTKLEKWTGEDISWMDSDSDDGSGPFVPFF